MTPVPPASPSTPADLRSAERRRLRVLAAVLGLMLLLPGLAHLL